MIYYRYQIVYDNPSGATGLVIYNQYTGQLFTISGTDNYQLQDGDVVMTDASYYGGGSNAPLDPATGQPINVTFAGSFSLTAVEYDDGNDQPTGTADVPEVLVYSDTPDPNDPADPLADTGNYAADSGTGEAATDPGYVEVDQDFFDTFDQYYDENEDPVYTGSACDSSVGIRG